MKVLVCGGRNYSDYNKLSEHLRELDPSIVVHGAARGADLLADRWAMENNVVVCSYPANWKVHGRAAGLIRNKLMLDEESPDHVIAFPDPGSKGTWHMVNIAKQAGVPVTVVDDR